MAGGSFTTVITAWPDVEDNSVPASVFRVIIYVGWLLFMSRVAASRILLIMTTALLSHQYKNLRSYFYSLDNIFQDDTVDISHKEKELKYVQALKAGFKLHSDTLW